MLCNDGISNNCLLDLNKLSKVVNSMLHKHVNITWTIIYLS